MTHKHITVLRKESLVQMIKNAPGTRLFNSLIVRHEDTGRVEDVFQDGNLSCAAFVSSLLTLTTMLSEPRATVASLRAVIEESSQWESVDVANVEPGDVVFWATQRFDNGEDHAHVGFVLNSEEAVSTDYKVRAVAKHPLVGTRVIDAVFRYRVI